MKILVYGLFLPIIWILILFLIRKFFKKNPDEEWEALCLIVYLFVLTFWGIMIKDFK